MKISLIVGLTILASLVTIAESNAQTPPVACNDDPIFCDVVRPPNQLPPPPPPEPAPLPGGVCDPFNIFDGCAPTPTPQGLTLLTDYLDVRRFNPFRRNSDIVETLSSQGWFQVGPLMGGSEIFLQVQQAAQEVRQFLSQSVPILSIADVPFGAAEGNGLFPVSGGTRNDDFIAVPCYGSCPQVEMGFPLIGRNFMTAAQKVEGGKGLLRIVNGGQEPTGIKPWPAEIPIKLVVEETNEAGGTLQMAFYAQIRIKMFFREHATPHFIGPIPMGTIGEGGVIIAALNAPPPPIPTNLGDIQNLISGFMGEPPTGGIDPENIDACDTYRGVQLGSLTAATAPNQIYRSNYAAVSVGPDGRVSGLGRFGINPNAEGLMDLVGDSPTKAWLERVQAGYVPSREEVDANFPHWLQNKFQETQLMEGLALAAISNIPENQRIQFAAQYAVSGNIGPQQITLDLAAHGQRVYENYQGSITARSATCQGL